MTLLTRYDLMSRTEMRKEIEKKGIRCNGNERTCKMRFKLLEYDRINHHNNSVEGETLEALLQKYPWTPERATSPPKLNR
jgi:hypothetical protein